MKHIWWKVHTSIQKGGDKKACQSQPKKKKERWMLKQSTKKFHLKNNKGHAMASSYFTQKSW